MRKVVERLGAHLAQRAPKPGREIDIGRAAHHLAHGLEHGGIDDQRRVSRLVLAERLEEDAVAMHGDHRVEQVGLVNPRVVRPDRLAERPQRNAQDEAVLAHDAMEAHAPTQIGREANRRRVARRLQHRRRSIVDEHDHAAAFPRR